MFGKKENEDGVFGWEMKICREGAFGTTQQYEDLVAKERRNQLLVNATQDHVMDFKYVNNVPLLMDRGGRGGHVCMNADPGGDWVSVMGGSGRIFGYWRELMRLMLEYLDKKGESPIIFDKWL